MDPAADALKPAHPKNTDFNELAWTAINKKPAIS